MSFLIKKSKGDQQQGARHCKVWGGLDGRNLTPQAELLFPHFEPMASKLRRENLSIARRLNIHTVFSEIEKNAY